MSVSSPVFSVCTDPTDTYCFNTLQLAYNLCLLNKREPSFI